MQTVRNRTSALAISSREFSEDTKEVHRLKAEIGEIPSEVRSVGSEIDLRRQECFTSIQSGNRMDLPQQEQARRCA